jgi:HTH-type transcriptional regulator / antitoxin HipB
MSWPPGCGARHRLESRAALSLRREAWRDSRRWLTKKDLADRAGKVRGVIYRIEAGQDVTVSSLVDVLRVLGLKLALVPAGIPSLEDVAKAFNEDEHGDADAA